MSTGKTIAWIDENPRDPEYGGEDDGTLIIHFTDGTALKIEGHSYESVSMSTDPMSQEDVRRRALGVQGQREQARLKRDQRAEWLSISCDDRVARIKAREARMSPFNLMMHDTIQGAWGDLMRDSNRMFLGDQPERRYKVACKRCRETSCENATEKVIPAREGFIWKGASFAVQVEPGSSRPPNPPVK